MNTNQKHKWATDMPSELHEGISIRNDVRLVFAGPALRGFWRQCSRYGTGNLTSCSCGIISKERPNK